MFAGMYQISTNYYTIYYMNVPTLSSLSPCWTYSCGAICLIRCFSRSPIFFFFFFSSRRRHTRFDCDWSSDVCFRSLEDALALVAARARLFERLPPSAMLSVGLSEEDVTPLLDPGVSLAAVNAPSQCVVSGNVDAIERDRKSTRLNSSHSQISYAVFC